jgi:hypothetical protein
MIMIQTRVYGLPVSEHRPRRAANLNRAHIRVLTVVRKLRGIESSLKISESWVSKLNWKVVTCKTGPGGDVRTDLSGLEREFESRIVGL